MMEGLQFIGFSAFRMKSIQTMHLHLTVNFTTYLLTLVPLISVSSSHNTVQQGNQTLLDCVSNRPIVEW